MLLLKSIDIRLKNNLAKIIAPYFLSQVPICSVNALLGNLPFIPQRRASKVNGHVVVNFINFNELQCNYEIFLMKINFHLYSGLFTKFLCCKNLEPYGTMICCIIYIILA